MATTSVSEAPKAAAKKPAGDNRYKILESTMKRYQYQQDALIEVLHHAQQLWGYLEDDLLIYIAHKLKVPPSRVYGVATFYHFFSLKPQGKHTCVLCLGTACYVKGGAELLNTISELAEIKSGETTSDNSMSLLSARCIGACGIAPAIVYDGAVAGNQTKEAVTTKIKEWLANGSE